MNPVNRINLSTVDLKPCKPYEPYKPKTLSRAILNGSTRVLVLDLWVVGFIGFKFKALGFIEFKVL